MRRLWSSAQCMGLVILALMGRQDMVSATRQVDAIYKIHRLEREYHVTAAVHLHRREATCLSSSYTLCASSDGGGCCPGGYACSSDACVATTDGPQTACDHTGFYNCPIESSPGNCCPVGFLCPSGEGDCTPAAGVSYACPASHSQCPSSLGYGCCPDGMGCASGSCTNTAPSTFPWSSTITTTNAKGDKVTSTMTSETVVTPSQATGGQGGTFVLYPTEAKSSVIAQETAIVTDSSDGSGGGGLSSGALGGIIAAVVIVLIAIIVAAFFIIRHLKRTEKAVAVSESRKESSAGGRGRAHTDRSSTNKSGFDNPSVSETTEGFYREYNKYQNRGRSSTATSSPHRNRTRTVSDTSGGFPNNPTSRLSPDASTLAGGSGPSAANHSGASSPGFPGYHYTVPLSEADSRPHSIDSGREGPNSNYERPPAATHRYSHDSAVSAATSMTRARHMSQASELESEHGHSELDADDGQAAGRRRSSSSSAVAYGNRGESPTPPHHNNPGSSLNPGARGRTESSAAAHALSTVNEMSEFPAVPGYYGSADVAVGQTAAGHDEYIASLPPVPKRQTSFTSTPTEAYQRDQ